jgi:hypothetical protein
MTTDTPAVPSTSDEDGGWFKGSIQYEAELAAARAEIAAQAATITELRALIKSIYDETELGSGVQGAIWDSDAGRLAIGETCQPGQPAACGDFHNAGQCVRALLKDGTDD